MSDLKPIDHVQFGVINPNELIQLSVVEIKKQATYENGLPVPGGLLDQRMGVTDRGLQCTTCNMEELICPGHFGHIKLAVPVVHPGFAKVVHSILRCVCYSCSRLLLDPNGPKKHEYKRIMNIAHPQTRLHEFAAICATIKKCPGGTTTESVRQEALQEIGVDGTSTSRGGCGCLQPTYRRHQYSFTRQFVKEAPKKDKDGLINVAPSGTDDDVPEHADLPGHQIHEILSKISDEDVIALGFNPQYAHPSWLVTTVLPVAPPQVRPSVTFNGSDRSSDDITVALAKIVQLNNAIVEQQNNHATDAQLRNDIESLTLACAQLVNNEMSNTRQMTSKSGKVLKTLRQRLVGKGGRIRSNLMGKRVNFCARTVITGDPNLGIDFVGVPRWVARTLTYPERVTDYNKERLQQLVRNGPENYPGAQRVIKPDGVIVHLKFSPDITLEPGYVVERHIIDDDFILFNRQPSLHKMSLMGHKARIMPFSSFRLNLSCTSPYNADFDGDEMNLHVAQTPMLRAEIAEIMLSPRQVVSPQASRPVMSIVQDSLLGVSKFTRRDTFCDRNLASNLFMCVDDWDGFVPQPAILKPIPMWTGKQIFSLIIPKGINVIRTSKHKPKTDTNVNLSRTDGFVLISDGQLVKGIVDGNTVGKTAGGLIHTIWLEKGWDDTRRFMTMCQKLVNNWLVTHGFSVGIADLVASPRALADVQKVIQDSDAEVERVIKQARSGELQRKPGHSITSTFEVSVNMALNQAISKSGQTVQEQLSRDNAINAMVYAGSKGSHLNISQIVACVGQQNVSQKRVPFSFRRRSLPHFLKEDLGSASRGFVARSYMKGLLPTEFYFHACGGREGLVDTAVKTAETGYIQRRLVKSMESIKVHYDATVRNSLGDIIQFVYGEDGMDGCYIEQLKLDHIKLDNTQLFTGYYYDLDDERLTSSTLQDEVATQLYENPDTVSKLKNEFKQLKEDRDDLRKLLKVGTDTIYLPCNVPRIIMNAQQKFGIKLEGGIPQDQGVIRLDLGQKSDLSPLDIIDEVTAMTERLIVIPGKSDLSRQAQLNATKLFKMYIRHMLASKRVLGEFHLTKESFKFVIGEIESRFKQAMVHPGEMVGAIAAQSIGEPATQMTLNTFHMAGYSAKNVTSGVPRLVEIINVATNVKASGMDIDLRDKTMAQDKTRTNKVLTRLEYTRVCDITETVEIYHDPDPENCCIEADQPIVSSYLDFPDDDYDYAKSSPWLIRIKLHTQNAVGKELTASQVAEIINQYFRNSKEKVKCLATESSSAENMILHVRVIPTNTLASEEQETGQDKQLQLAESLKNIVLTQIKLCGITGITKIFLDEKPISYYDQSTGSFIEPKDADGKNKKMFYLQTEGTNLKEVITEPDVDHTTCYSNFCPDMLGVFGIEATRASVLKELRGVIEADGSYISYRHIAMLVDIMTFKGGLMSITRNGFNRLHTGPLMRCSFEESVEILMDAAAFSENDPLRGISEKVMMGQLADIGTGSFDVVLDVNKLSQISTDEAAAVPTGDMNAMDDFVSGPTPWLNQDTDMNSFAMMGLSDIEFANPTSGVYANPTSSSYITSSVVGPSIYSSSINPMVSAAYSPTSPGAVSPTSPGYASSPRYSPQSPGYSPTSPSFSPTSPNFMSPTSPSGHFASPGYSPQSPSYNAQSPGFTSPGYSPTSPTSPNYTAQSPGYNFSPTSPNYNSNFSPTSPNYAFSPSSPSYSPTTEMSPGYSPTGD